MDISISRLDDTFREQVAQRDPLALDSVLRRLPEINSAGDSVSISRVLKCLELEGYIYGRESLPDCLAAMRDIGFLVASMRRHGVDFPSRLPLLEGAMLGISKATGMAPRETVLHYCWWNPEGQRQRTFTGTSQESNLISATRSSLPHTEKAAQILATLRHFHPRDPDYVMLGRQTEASIRKLAECVQLPQSGLDAHHFAKDLRHYFLPVNIGGRHYHGAAAAQVPLYLIDLAVWGDRAGEEIKGLWRDLASYGLPVWRSLFQDFSEGRSLILSMTSALAEAKDAVVEMSAQSLVRIIRALVEFRGRHRRLVRTAYKGDEGAYSEGSSGATPELIDQLLSETRKCSTAVSGALCQREAGN
ncbi:DUF1864 family protein [Streptomyces sp. TX20-6-3]|uniref:monodechloroaminopyrrolnitrin synthase PrnB family protein n=1 Tax=Streptomyces sp. TX20-6-3 TaxID=3028705 RepID=UPI0029BDFBF6|nr:monodechloroaminopyrrolnitrin synthase PrnB family protein [Streptomyces sp. TX20-6-3]MDX2565341.1 DUF1864 family protein [Streptomyces sp. TX20-6-3]